MPDSQPEVRSPVLHPVQLVQLLSEWSTRNERLWLRTDPHLIANSSIIHFRHNTYDIGASTFKSIHPIGFLSKNLKQNFYQATEVQRSSGAIMLN
ncbi:MAG: hypothetical protein C7B45_06350 [Sulfobacillus acidophilus]|uniref:Uncharacterized protein n=1 Tax=Sulfobacillus acidophilus TaxID=53633 RepID=A0A2T2WJZ6_9FIRM|nr:MAG: hypothetical protein C7B45_06350 [Sulfobacillus acidophilus]